MRQALIAAFACALTFGVAGAQAYETPNTAYVGTHSGGGTVELHVSPSGTAIDYIDIKGLPGERCGSELEIRGSVPIVDHTFDLEEPPSYYRGTFGAGDTVTGTLRYSNGSDCDTQVLSWTATAAVPPPPVPPPFHGACHVPKVVGRTLATARRMLRSASCRFGRVTRAYSPRAKKGRVLSQRPRAGRWVPVFRMVNLVVGRGPRPR